METRVSYKKMSINDKINFKAVRLPIWKEVFKKHNIQNSNKVLKKTLFGCNWDEAKFGVVLQNPKLGNGNKSFRRIKLEFKKIEKQNLYLISTGFC